MWAYLDGAQTRNTRLVRKVFNKGLAFAADSDQDARMQLRILNNGTVAVKDTVPHTVYVGAWHHFAATYSATEAKLYVDGVLKATLNHTAGLAVWDTQPMYFAAGFPTTDPSEHFKGRLDDIRFWNYVRSQEEIAANMNRHILTTVPGLVGHWRFNEGTGQVVSDSSGFGNHGTRGSNSLPAGDASDGVWITPLGATPSPADCNGNAIPDSCDFAAGTSSDCNNNGIPDECESDCNGNGVADGCDIAAGTVQDCNQNGIPDACDIARGTSIDANSNGVPDSCEPDIRIVPVVTLVNPAATSEIRGAEPASAAAVTRGGFYYVEVWASDLGSTNTGISGLYVDMNFCTQSIAQEVQHGTIYTVFPGGTILTGKVDEFGGSALPGGAGVAPQWVRIGWVKMLAGLDVPTCSITLTQGAGGVAALGRGLIPDSLVSRGSTTIQIVEPARTYDLDGSTLINVGDLSLFATSWQQPVPPGAEAHDFDCNEFVGVSDLSWFATGWLKNVDDPTILYPPCVDGGGGRGGEAGAPDVRFKLVVRSSTSGTDTVLTTPASLTSISAGQQFFVEVWASDVGDVNTGLTSAYLNLAFPPEAAVVSVNHHGVFNVFPSAQTAAGTISNLGGSTLNPDTASEPLWVRVASVRMLATASRPVFVFDLSPSSIGVAAYGRGEVPWSGIELPRLPIGTPQLGDLDGDGDVDEADVALFVPVLLGEDTEPGRLARSDVNQDASVNGADVQGFVELFLQPN